MPLRILVLFLTYAVSILLPLLSTSVLNAQERFSNPFDSLSTRTAADTSDTLKVLKPPPGSTIESPIKYNADRILFVLSEQSTRLEGNATIRYQLTTLTADRITIDWVQSVITAEGVADSTDSLGLPVFRTPPTLSESGEEPIRGTKLSYNFKTQRGRVWEGKTNLSPGYYRGSQVDKVGNETLLIQDGYFTTCDLDHPHYYFRSSKMRVRVKRTAVAKPIIFYIADVPILAAPFAAFSLRRGRRSGIILPTYGQSSFGGRFLQNFGYYFAPSDYWDFTLLTTFYENTGFLYSGDGRYKKRYSFDGYVRANYSPRDVNTGAQRERWELNSKHTQKIGQTLQINATGKFQSDKNFRSDFYNNFEDQIEQQLTSSLQISKTLPGSRSLSFNARRDENLQTGSSSYDFPDVRFDQRSRSLFYHDRSTGEEAKWFHDIKYGYDTRLRGTGTTTTGTTITSTELVDRYEDAVLLPDTIVYDTTNWSKTVRKAAWTHNLNFTHGSKAFKYFSITNGLNFGELWVPEYLDYRFDAAKNTIVADTVKSFRARHSGSASIGVRTTVYGLWEVPLLPVSIIRHKMDPSISFSVTPDYTADFFDYFQTVEDTSGNSFQFDRFAGNLGGGTPSGNSRSMNIGLSNLFQGKIIRDGEETKVDLFTMNFNTSYDFTRDSLNFSNLRTTFRAQPHRSLNIGGGATHSFYKSGGASGRRDEFVWKDGFQLPDLISWNVTANTNFSFKPKDNSTDEAAEAEADSLDDPFVEDVFKESQLDREGRDTFKGFTVPWKIDFNPSFSYNRNAVSSTSDWSFNTRINASMQLSENWRINYNSWMNLKDMEIVNQSFAINRDLHCWEMSFNWTPSTTGNSFYRLEIRVKESTLRDLKLTKTASGNRPF